MIELELQNSYCDAKIVSIGIEALGCDGDNIRNFISKHPIRFFALPLDRLLLQKSTDRVIYKFAGPVARLNLEVCCVRNSWQCAL